MYELLQLAHVGTRKLHFGPRHGVAEGDKAETVKDKSNCLLVLALMGRTILLLLLLLSLFSRVWLCETP